MKRRSKKASEPETVEQILGRWLKSNRLRARVGIEELRETWAQTVGEEIAAHSRVTEFEGGMLNVEVDSPPLLHELSTYHSSEIVDSLSKTETFRHLREIRFRSGSFRN